ncbi:DUF4097 family beta strand repeat-containing protein [Flagellimonas sp. CMM7]|uniref:DUF4097 family beta strand repeat-containing protein n=1 Tax=Flagellimonas sp. CMM7 TaxID=2654676 RepID=UPI0013D257DA|nr:DUF4097 family beta strand repeat-containing protein [Flagellimonas sp. CMM7]UII80901.1 hypothetical protein LV704_05155 [Flagellimonas sp. CMM7]
MKHLIFMVCLSSVVGIQCTKAQQEKFTEQIKKEIPFSNSTENTLVIKNVFGSILVEGYNGSQIVLEVEKTITADNTSGLELGKQELELKVIQEANRVVFHPDAPYIQFDKDNLRYNWCNNYEEPQYGHKLNFKVKVPHSIKIDVSTVNDGEVLVENTKGNTVIAENINGGITLTNITGKTWVDCINGGVNISYSSNPKSSSRYYSLNGDINISYQKALSANISFKSMNGEMFTDFDINKQFMQADKKTGNENRAKYKYEAKPIVQIGDGKVDFDFETLNGNVFIKKI